MKKIIAFILFLFLIYLVYAFFINRPINYEITYKVDDLEIKEQYDKEKGYYLFNIGNEYDYVVKHKYTKKRKNITKVLVQEKCISIKVFDSDSEFICHDDDYHIKLKENSSKLISNKNNISIYNDDYDIYVWNNFGITDLINNKDYKFLKKEKYDNPLYYLINEYLLVPDYDMERTFNKFYIFNYKTRKVSELLFDYNISFDSYFMGDFKNNVYLYDKTNEIQYKINIAKKNIFITSDEDGLLYNDGQKFEMVDKTKYKYNVIKFSDNDVYNYKLINNNLTYHYYNSKINISIIKNVDDIIKYNEKDIFFLKDTHIYHYNINKGLYKIVSNFEWNFNYKDKLFIFN